MGKPCQRLLKEPNQWSKCTDPGSVLEKKKQIKIFLCFRFKIVTEFRGQEYESFDPNENENMTVDFIFLVDHRIVLKMNQN